MHIYIIVLIKKALGNEPLFRSGGPDVKEVPKNSMPWLVLLPPWWVRNGTGPSRRPLCGGTLIGKRHVLSAAHCTPPHDAVIVGEHNIRKEDGEQAYTVAKVEDHPKWGIY